jgi:hypothetical protein
VKRHPGGRPSDYGRVDLDQARILAEKGFTDQELADFFGVVRSTISLWKKEHPEFSDALKLGKEAADRKVERSLFERATGYSHPDTHFSAYEGIVTETPTTKVYPPDTTAAIFWLKNRKPDEWRDRQEVHDDRLGLLLAHMNRPKEESHVQETRKPKATARRT